MNAADRAESALYATQDCGGAKVTRARGNVAKCLGDGLQPRMRDVRALETAARMSGNTVRDWRAPRPETARIPLGSRAADACVRVLEAFRAIPGGEPSQWRDAVVFLIGTSWGAMVAVGILLAIAARHAP